MNTTKTEHTELISRARELAKLREKATPGPWALYNDSDPYGAIVSDSGRIVLTIYEANCWGIDKHLVAAAPEMAELLEKMAEELERLND